MNAELYAKLKSTVRGMTDEECDKLFKFIEALKTKNDQKGVHKIVRRKN